MNGGITLSASSGLRKAITFWENQSIIEDDANHFHVDGFATDSKAAFMLGVKTAFLLAEKFQSENIGGVRVTYSFMNPEMGKDFAVKYHVHKEGDEYFCSDRLSFFTRRTSEEVLEVEENISSAMALMAIDI